MLRECVAQYMPCLRTVTNELQFTIDDVPTAQMLQPAFESRTIDLPSEGKTATLTSRVYLKAPLFSMVRANLRPSLATFEGLEENVRRGYVEMVEQYVTNGVWYLVEPCAQGQNGYGLHVLHGSPTDVKAKVERNSAPLERRQFSEKLQRVLRLYRLGGQGSSSNSV